MLEAPEQCVILVGGLGTRLGGLTGDLPKPMVGVGGKPFLSYLLWHARRLGFKRALLLAGHRAARLVDVADALAEQSGLEISVSIEPEPRGTGGALRFAADRLDERFLLLNGDSVFDFNWLDLVALGDENTDVVMSLMQSPDAARYGLVELRGDQVTALRERGGPGAGCINGGVYLMSRKVAEAAPATASLEADVLPALIARGRVRGRAHKGFFLDIGVPDSLAAAQVVVPASLRRPAVFFDRDGVINLDRGYVYREDEFEFVPGAIEAVKAVNDRGMFAFLVTNQGGIGRGFYGAEDVEILHAFLQRQLRRRGAHFDDIRFCPHHPLATSPQLAKECDWRKPGPGMLLDLAAKWPVDLGASWLVGDNDTDMAAGAAAGVSTLRFRGGDLQAFMTDNLKGSPAPGG